MALRTDPLAFGSTWAEERKFDSARWKERARRGADSNTTSQWLAEDGRGRLVGMAVVAEVEGVVNVFSMWVDPSFRGRGVGARLLDTGLAWAGSTFPSRPVRLDVNPDQLAAISLYTSRGFRKTGAARPLGHTPGASVVEMIRPPEARK